MSIPHKFAAVNEARVFKSVVADKGKTPVNRILMGTYVGIVEEKGDWYKVNTVGTDGWMHKDDLRDTMGMKIYSLDVGQGDGVLIEVGKLRILIDAGPNSNMYNYLTKWQYGRLLKKGNVHIDAVFVSHFDADHFKGLGVLIDHKRFSFGRFYHAGILKFAEKGNKYSTGLGDTVSQGADEYLTTIFDDLIKAKGKSPFNRDITPLINSLSGAAKQGRLKQSVRLCAGDIPVNEMIDGQQFKIEVLAPFLENVGGAKGYLYFKDDGKTINGHSLVLKITFGGRSFLFGGDLNSLSEEYIVKRYGNANPLEVDLAKSCHHGSSDFTESFMARVNPYATLISSGDNEGYAHPRADAIGCAGKYSRGARPLVFSTELARSVNPKTSKIIYGMINVRCDGKNLFISQMKEVKKPDDLWDSYVVK